MDPHYIIHNLYFMYMIWSTKNKPFRDCSLWYRGCYAIGWAIEGCPGKGILDNPHIYIYIHILEPVRFIGHIWKHQRSIAWWNLPNRCPRRNGEAITFKVTFSEQPKLMVQFLRSYSNIGDATCSDRIGKILRNMWAQKNPRVRVKFSAHKAL